MRSLISSMIFCFILGWLPAQEQGGQRGGDRPSERPRPEQPQTQPRRDDTRQQRIDRPIFLQGRVLMDDGSKPAEPVEVELLCFGNVYRQVYSSLDGTFSFQISSSPHAGIADSPMDASVSGSATRGIGLGGNDPFGGGSFGSTDWGVGSQASRLNGCEIRADHPGYQSETINLGPRRAMDNPDVGVIILHRRGQVKGTIVSVNSLKAPDKAKKSYEKAQKELSGKKPNYSKAVSELEKAVKEYPEFSAAWYLLGEIRVAEQNQAEARNAFEKAIEADPGYINPYLSWASLEMEQKEWDTAAQLSSRVLELNPYAVRAHYLHGVSSYFLGRGEAAEKSMRFVQESSEAATYPGTHYLLGALLSTQGNYEEAAGEFRQFLTVNENPEVATQVQNQLQQWEQEGLIAAAPQKTEK